MCRKLIYLATLGLVASLFVPGSAEAADPTLAAYWKFDETSGTTALDSSGNGNTGRLVGDPKWVAGRFGGALEFNGNDYVNCGNGASLQIRNQITITFWFKVRAFSNVWETFLAKGDNSYRASRSGVVGNATHMGASGTSVGGGNGWFDGAVVITDNRWHHWAGVYDGAAGRIYIDGVLDTTRAGTGRINHSGYNFYIGENAQTTGRFLHGLMDEVRLYSRALTNNEIKDVMAGAGTEYPYASSPNPADGALHEYTWVTLGWVPGDHAVSHDVYFRDNRADVEGGTGGTFCGNQVETSFTVGLPGSPYPDGLVPGTTYYWRIDEVNDNELNSPWKGNVWSFSIPSHAQEGVNELTNGGFEEGPSMPLNTWAAGTWNVYGWHTVQVVSELRGAAVPEAPIEGKYCLHVTVPVAGANFWDVGLQHLGHTFKRGKKYTLSAFLKCKRGTLRVNLKPELGENPWTGYGERQVTMTDKWAEYSTTTPVFDADVTPGSLTFHIAFAAGDFWVDGVRWYEGDYVPPSSSLFGVPTNLGSTVNSAYWEASPSISTDGLALFFDSDRPAGSGERDLYVTTRATKNDDWGRPVNLGQPVNTPFYDGQPGISADGRSLYFSSDRPGGFGDQDLWVTTRPTIDDGWGTPVNLGSTVNGRAHDTEPSISADGLSLFFDSDRPGGYGSWDLWVATRASTDDRWRTPVPLPPPVNSAFNDGEPSISADGRTLYFCSNRPGGYGTHDLWVATRETTDDQWSTPVNLGSTVNTTYHDWGPSISTDGSTLYFTAEHVRTLRVNDYDLWQVSLGVSGLEDFETGNFSKFSWWHSGDSNWTISQRERHSGAYSAEAGTIGDDEYTTLEITLDCISGDISFYRKVSSESGFDYLRFYIDGVEKGAWSGEEDWAEVSFQVDEGTRKFEWTYSKDDSASDGEDTAWIDDIVFPLKSNPPVGPEPPDNPDTPEGFDLYLDYIAPNIINSSWFDKGILDYYCRDNPASGNYCIHWAGVSQYSAISFRFVPVKDLSVLVDEGYAIDFWVRCNSPNASIGIRFVDTKTNNPTDHPWRMLYILNQSVGVWDGRWNHLQIPLNDFFEHGSWDNDRWYDPIGAFDWTATEYFEIVAEFHDLTGIHFYFDDIRVVDLTPAGRP